MEFLFTGAESTLRTLLSGWTKPEGWKQPTVARFFTRRLSPSIEQKFEDGALVVPFACLWQWWPKGEPANPPRVIIGRMKGVPTIGIAGYLDYPIADRWDLSQPIALTREFSILDLRVDMSDIPVSEYYIITNVRTSKN